MQTMGQELETGVKLIKSTIANLENNVLKAGKNVDKKTISVVSRLMQLLEKTINVVDAIAKKTASTNENILELSQYLYLLRTPGEIIILRTRPEHVALTFNSKENYVSLKTRNASLTISPNSVALKARGVEFSISPLTIENFDKRRDELRILLRELEKTIYRRLVPLVEVKVAKK
ncbi:MAG: hypothetical protein QXV54_02705 [Desulfurococcaceae archaeon]